MVSKATPTATELLKLKSYVNFSDKLQLCGSTNGVAFVIGTINLFMVVKLTITWCSFPERLGFSYAGK
jgi:hypothetical protein